MCCRFVDIKRRFGAFSFAPENSLNKKYAIEISTISASPLLNKQHVALRFTQHKNQHCEIADTTKTFYIKISSLKKYSRFLTNRIKNLKLARYLHFAEGAIYGEAH